MGTELKKPNTRPKPVSDLGVLPWVPNNQQHIHHLRKVSDLGVLPWVPN